MKNLFVCHSLVAAVVALVFTGSARTVHRSFVNGYPSAAATAPETSAPAKAAVEGENACEKMVAALLPPEKLNEMVGFFAPVVKKYQPKFDQFAAEYKISSNKLSTVAKYMPAAEDAYKEAQAMKVPARFEQQKKDYLKILKALLFSTKLTTRAYGAWRRK